MKRIKGLVSVLLATSVIFAFAGCKNTDTQNKDQQATSETAQESMVKGDVKVSGSTSVEKIANAEGEEFAAYNPDVKFSYEAIGSSGGIKNANEGVTPIGSASRNLKEEEKSWGMKEVVIAYDGIAIAVHPSNTVKDLTMEDIAAIYKGEITNWSQVGGSDKPIVVVSREDGSGTRGAFEELLDFEKLLTKNALIAEGNGNVQSSVAGNENAIGYVSLTSMDESIKALTVEGVEATIDNVLSEQYKISRPFLMVYHEKNMNEATNAYIEFILSEEGQAIVKENGGIPVK